MTRYIRPLVQVGPSRPLHSVPLAGGWGWFTDIEVLSRSSAPTILSAVELSAAERDRLCRPRASISGIGFDAPRLMGILNVTPDSFSDGGQNADLTTAIDVAQLMQAQGADIIDVGGESTRPGATYIAPDIEIARTAPVISALRTAGLSAAISIDTRKAGVAKAALSAGANVVNDVSGFTFDAGLASLCVAQNTPVCVMHAQGDPATMQDDPRYDDVLLDVYDFLAQRIEALVGLGIPREQIIADPGIGFGKKLPHNLLILQRISLFHSRGVPILLGASRKKFIVTIGGVHAAGERGAGSVGVALAALSQGVQIIRAHDVALHAQAIALWRAGMAQGMHE